MNTISETQSLDPTVTSLPDPGSDEGLLMLQQQDDAIVT